MGVVMLCSAMFNHEGTFDKLPPAHVKRLICRWRWGGLVEQLGPVVWSLAERVVTAARERQNQENR